MPKIKRKPKIVSALQYVNLIFFFAAISTITLLHVNTDNFLDILRLPRLIHTINPLVGHGWPASLHVYQFVMVFSIILIFINSLGLFYYSSKIWRFATDISSFLGFLIIWPTALFFVFTIASAENLKVIDFQTAIVYFGVTFSIFILDLITWFIDDQSLLKVTKRK